MTKIPHLCETCGKQLTLENRVYFKGKYYCDYCFRYRRKSRKKKMTATVKVFDKDGEIV